MTAKDEFESGATVHSVWESTEAPSNAVVEAVAHVTDRDLQRSPPLYDYIEADALDDVLTAARSADRLVEGGFDYDGVAVVVDSDGNIETSLAIVE